MLIERYKEALGKSNHGGQSLYCHTFQAVDAGLRAARLIPDVPKRHLDILMFGLCVHDVGKLDPGFQKMLQAVIADEPLPPKRIKHEASTFDYDHVALVENHAEEIRDELRGMLAYELDLSNVTGKNMDWVWALTVSHHGLFYVSYERGQDDVLRPLIRRTWTSFYPNEEERITLVDLLFHFYPIGGLVIIGDLMASYAFEQRRDLAWTFDGMTTLPMVFDRLLGVADDLEESIRQYDPRNYGLREMLRLLAAGCV